MFHYIFNGSGFDVDSARLHEPVSKILLVRRQPAILGFHLQGVEHSVLHGDAVRDAFGGTKALQDWKMKDAFEVEVIFDLVLDLCFFGRMRLG